MKNNYRLGNRVNLHTFKGYELKESDLSYISVQPNNDYNPIPLDEKWLLELKFTKMEIESPNDNYFILVNEDQQIRIVKNKDDIKAIYLDTINGMEAIKHQLITKDSNFFEVHTLQNLISDHSNPNYPFK